MRNRIKALLIEHLEECYEKANNLGDNIFRADVFISMKLETSEKEEFLEDFGKQYSNMIGSLNSFKNFIKDKINELEGV